MYQMWQCKGALPPISWTGYVEHKLSTGLPKNIYIFVEMNSLKGGKRLRLSPPVVGEIRASMDISNPKSRNDCWIQKTCFLITHSKWHRLVGIAGLKTSRKLSMRTWRLCNDLSNSRAIVTHRQKCGMYKKGVVRESEGEESPFVFLVGDRC